jgi:hypothetical protein
MDLQVGRNDTEMWNKSEKYCNEFAGSISQWKFITLKIQYTTINYNQ